MMSRKAFSRFALMLGPITLIHAANGLEFALD